MAKTNNRHSLGTRKPKPGKRVTRKKSCAERRKDIGIIKKVGQPSSRCTLPLPVAESARNLSTYAKYLRAGRHKGVGGEKKGR